MTPEQEKLWQAIENFELDDPLSSFTFTDRLARENRWSLEYAIRAVYEYKRFMFLICATDGPKVPSDHVDQVWHLHLLYTQSYWKEFCGQVLKREVHHGPTKGVEEREVFSNGYATTLAKYEQFFDEQAPVDIWPTPENRFKYIRFVRVNLHKNWIFRKFF